MLKNEILRKMSIISKIMKHLGALSEGITIIGLSSGISQILKVEIINMLKVLVVKVDNIQAQIGEF
jgi:hypothetical protein